MMPRKPTERVLPVDAYEKLRVRLCELRATPEDFDLVAAAAYCGSEGLALYMRATAATLRLLAPMSPPSYRVGDLVNGREGDARLTGLSGEVIRVEPDRDAMDGWTYHVAFRSLPDTSYPCDRDELALAVAGP